MALTTVQSAMIGTANAAVLLGPTLSSNVTASSLTSVGTLGSLTVSGTSTTGAQQINVNSNGGITTAIQITDSASGAGAFSVVTFSGALAQAYPGDILIANNVGNVILSPNAGGKSLHFTGGAWTNSPGLTVNGSNYVGIGGASPNYPLDVSGTVRLGNGVGQGAPSSSNLLTNAHTILNGTGGNYLAFGQYTSGNNYAQWIQSAYQTPSTATYNLVLNPLGGYVGIGTNTPQAPLHIVGGNSNGSAGSSMSGISMQASGGNYQWITPFYQNAPLNGTWYTVWNWGTNLYQGTFFMLMLGYEDNSGDGNDQFAMFTSASGGDYTSGLPTPVRLTGSTNLSAQITTSGSNYILQVKQTQSAGTGGNFKGMLFLMSGE
jgi:hypothetical protein